MLEAVVWWLTIEILGVAAIPVGAVLLRPLADRGYAMSKILGLLLVGWLAYILAMVKLPFGRGLLFLCLLALVGFSAWLLYRDGRALLTELRERYSNRSFQRYVIAAELLFAVAFTLWAIFRSYNPDIWGTEKFMDYGFMNAILRSGAFPPKDMWMSGFSINYYYFGYVLVASLTALSGVRNEVAFNLANVTLFALAALGAFGVTYNLIAGHLTRRTRALAVETRDARGALPARRKKAAAPLPVAVTPADAQKPVVPARRTRSVVSAEAGSAVATAVIEKRPPRKPAAQTNGSVQSNGHEEDMTEHEAPVRHYAYEADDMAGESGSRVPFFLSPYLYAVLAALMVVAMGNLTTMFAVKDGNFNAGANGWRFCFNCQTSSSFDWWGPSRIIRDYTTTAAADGTVQKVPAGNETINEFPAFSFLLADMHPHVMALPLVLLAVSAGYAFSRRRHLRDGRWLGHMPGDVNNWVALVVAGIILGSLYTANTWDYPTYLLIVVGGMALAYAAAGRNAAERAGARHWVLPWLGHAAFVVAVSLISFLPFHLTFKSLVGGQPAQIPDNLKGTIAGFIMEKLGGLLLLNTNDKTITGFLVIFGIFLVAIVGWLLHELLAVFAGNDTEDPSALSRKRIFVTVVGAVTLISLVLAFLLRFPLLGLLLPLATLAIGLIALEPGRIERNFALGIFALGAIIGLGVEIVYLRDVFNDRMNTLFKFYYQLWVLWSLAAAYGIWRVLYSAFYRRQRVEQRSRTYEPAPEGTKTLQRVYGVLLATTFGLLVASGLMYSINGPGRIIHDRTQDPNLVLSFDGINHFSRSSPGDLEAINWLNRNAGSSDVVLECCRDEYVTHAGRISAYTGIPTILAWDGHENQWRGGQPVWAAEIGPRRQTIDALYQGVDPANPGTANSLTAPRLLEVLHQYGVTYVVVGETERGIGGAAGQFPEERVTEYAESVMKQAMSIAFKSSNGATVIYKVPQSVPQGGDQNGNRPTGPAPHP